MIREYPMYKAVEFQDSRIATSLEIAAGSGGRALDSNPKG